MPSIDVCLSPLLHGLFRLEGKVAVVVDVLRATTTMITALEYGAEAILPVDTVEQCLEFQEQGYIGAAERGGKVVDGFRFGNSPFDYMTSDFTGRKIVFTTTNGTRTLSAIKEAEVIVLGAFVNLKALSLYLKKLDRDILVVCAGWEGQINLEDTLFAGALIDQLIPDFHISGDPALLSHTSYLKVRENLSGYLESSSHVRRLRKLGLQKDIDFCLTSDRFEIIPRLSDGHIVRS